MENDHQEVPGEARKTLFRYYPDPVGTGAFWQSEDGEICGCCGKKTHLCYDGPFYAGEDVTCLCPDCIASGAAAEKFRGSFFDVYGTDRGVDDPARLDVLYHRTPCYPSFQESFWRSHCGDFCAYLGPVGAAELNGRGLLREVLDDPFLDSVQKEMVRESVRGGRVQCHLFRCLHCGKHLVWAEGD